MVKTFFAMVFLLPSFAAGVNALLSEQTSMMRRHENSVQLSSEGKVIQDKVSDASKPELVLVSREDQLANLARGSEQVSDLCNYNYTAGPTKTSTCTNANVQKLIEADSMCMSAAKMACPTPPHTCVSASDDATAPWLVKDDPVEMAKFPARCFMTADNKWRFNPTGDVAASNANSIESGTPICVEVEFEHGTNDTNLCAKSEYDPILDEFECQTARICLGGCSHQEFRILDNVTQDKRPKGCHYGPTDGCIYFNNMSSDLTPTTPTGAPLCKLNIHGGATHTQLTAGTSHAASSPAAA